MAKSKSSKKTIKGRRSTKSSKRPSQKARSKKVQYVTIRDLGTGATLQVSADASSVGLPSTACHMKAAIKRNDGWFEFAGIDGDDYETADVVYERLDYWDKGDFVFVYLGNDGPAGKIYRPARILSPKGAVKAYARSPKRMPRNDWEVANAIAELLGGTSRLYKLIGARDFQTKPKGLYFRWNAKADNNADNITITREREGSYLMEFGNRKGGKVSGLASYEAIPPERVAPWFEHHTGLSL